MKDLFNILYTDTGCNRLPEILSIMQEIISRNVIDFRDDQELLQIDRWNLYQPNHLHIVYIYRQTTTGKVVSSELVCGIGEFLVRWRDLKLIGLGI